MSCTFIVAVYKEELVTFETWHISCLKALIHPLVFYFKRRRLKRHVIFYG